MKIGSRGRCRAVCEAAAGTHRSGRCERDEVKKFIENAEVLNTKMSCKVDSRVNQTELM